MQFVPMGEILYNNACEQKTATLNKRNELMSECRHSKKILLNNAIT